MAEHTLPSGDDLDDLFDDLFRRARRGEPDAMEELFSLLRRFVERQARRFTKTKEDAEDITSDALIRTLLAIRAGTLNYEGRGRLYTWLGKAVRSAAIDSARWLQRRPRQTAFDPEELAGRPYPQAPDPEDRALCAELWRTLDRLPERQRQILELRYVLGLSRAETAQVLKLSISTVRREEFAGLAQLARILRDEGSAPPDPPEDTDA